jgi:hypothetical protein
MLIVKKWMIYVFMVVVMILTSPDLESHETKIQDIFTYSGSNANIVQVSLNQSPSLTYHDIYIFTYTKHNRRVLTFGAFGIVFDVGS